MAGGIENCSKFEVCVVVRFLQAEVSQSEIHHRLVSVYGQKHKLITYSCIDGGIYCIRPESFQLKGSVCVLQQI
jgi:hypothetical protein